MDLRELRASAESVGQVPKSLAEAWHQAIVTVYLDHKESRYGAQ
jgi:hypothetical protein